MWIAVALLVVAAIAGAVAIVRTLTRVSEAVPEPEAKAPPPELRPLRFEALSVDAKGAVVERRKSEARSFVETAGAVGLEMIEVPAGTCEMGAPERRAAAASPFVAAAFVQEPAPAPRAMPRPNPYQYPPRPRARPRPMPTNEPQRQPEPEPKKKSEARQKRAPEPEPTPPAEIDDETERPGHAVTVRRFFMSRYEVTQAEWRAVAALPKVERDLNRDPSEFKGDNLPVDNVSWEDATEFCARLSRAAGRTYRLPTEAEWEYACRAGSTGWFAFGPTITTDLVNYDGGTAFGEGPVGVARRKTLPVGGLGSANAFGLSDMHGNVWEWCLDVWHPDYAGAPADGSAWTAGGDPSFRVIRGGSWITGPSDCRSARRVNNPPGNRNSDVGFRVVMS
jgi:formylglycine-generating enzyme required for sulfatase activity